MTRKSFVGQFKPPALLEVNLAEDQQANGLHDIFIFLPANWCSTRHVRRQRSFSWCLYLPPCKLMLHSPREEAKKVHLGLNWGGKGKKIVDCLFLTFFCCSGSSWADYGAVEQWDGSSLEETPRRDVRDYDCCFYFYLWLVKGKVKFYILTFSDQLILNLFFLF